MPNKSCRCDYCFDYKFKHFDKYADVLTFMKFLYFAEKESVGSNTAIKLFNKHRKKIDIHHRGCKYFHGAYDNSVLIEKGFFFGIS